MMSPTGEPITQCPVCRYDLTGLPRNHRCPECGFEYDEAARVWSLRTRSYLVLTGALLAVVLFVLAAKLVRTMIVGIRPWEDLVGLVAFLVISALYVVAFTSPAFIMVGKSGVVVRLAGGRPVRYAWSDLVLVPDRRVLVHTVKGKLKPIAFMALLSKEGQEALRATCVALKPVNGGADTCHVE